MERGYKQGEAHSCSMCGQPTRSKLPMCSRPGRCGTEYMRLTARAANGTGARKAGKLPGAHPCSMCGQPTRSRYPVCDRPGACHAEYSRWQRQKNPRRRNATAVRHHRKQKGGQSVYAVWFPVPRVLKVGFTVHTQNSIFASVARTRAARRGFDAAGSSCIWRMPGDTRTEAWMQATLAFRWRRTHEDGMRLCEWFLVPDLTEEAIIGVLNEVYGLVPVDLTGDIPAAPPQATAKRPPGTLF